MINKDELARDLRKARTERLLTQKQVAGITGVSQFTITRIENAKASPTELTLAKLRRAFPELQGEII